MSKDKIAKTLGIDDLEILPPVDESKNAKKVEDLELARTNVINTIDIGNEALKEMVLVAKSSDEPRAYEVVAGLIKTLVDANEKLVDLPNKVKVSDTGGGPKTVNNNLFVGSNAELLKMIQDMSDASKE
jgi:hypothetical protein